MILIVIGILLVINTLIALSYLIYKIVKKDSSKGLVIFTILFFCPIVSSMFFLLGYLFHKILYFIKKSQINEFELSFSKQRVRVIEGADIVEDANRVPIEEALIISDKFSKRRTFLNMLKAENYEDSLTIIKDAMESDDTEISHYAASSITDTVSAFKYREKELALNYQLLDDDKSALQYVHFMMKFLKSNILSEIEQKMYLTRMEEFLDEWKQKSSQALTGELLSDIITLFQHQKEYENIEKWLSYLEPLYEGDLDAFKAGLKYYYWVGNKEHFLGLLKRMKESSLVLDNEALEWIRFFQ